MKSNTPQILSWMCNFIFSNLENSRQNSTKNPTDCMALHYIDSHHPLSSKEGIIYSQALRYNMIISEDHIFQENLTTKHIFCWLSHIHYMLPWITKTALIYTRSNLLSQRDTTYKNKYSPHHHSLPHFPLSRNLNRYPPIQHLTGFTTTLFTPH